MKVIVILATLVVAPIAFAHVAFAHESPLGWQYPRDCCGGKDCRPISCSTANPKADGSVEWVGLVFQREQVKYSGDAMCHVCVGYNEHNRGRYPHCIFLSPMN